MNTKYLIEEHTLKDIADSIREIEEHDSVISVESYADRIRNMHLMPHEYLVLDLLCQNITTYISDIDKTISPSDADTLAYYIKLYNTLGGGYNV